MTPTAERFRDSVDHVMAEMKRLDLMLRRAVLLSRRARSSDGPDEFRGLVISEENVDRMLETVDFLGDIWKMDQPTHEAADAIDSELERRQTEIRARMEASAQAGEKLALAHMAAVCSLSPAEVDILLIALAPELEPRYEMLYAYLQNDVTRKRPSVDLTLNLICRTPQEKVQARDLFAAEGSLQHFHLLELLDEPYDRSPTLLRRFLKIDDNISRFLLDRPAGETAGAQMVVPKHGLAALETSPQTRAALGNLVKSLERGGPERTVIQLWGDADAPLDEAAVALAYEIGKQALKTDITRLDPNGGQAVRLVRDAALWDNVLIVSRGRSDLPEAELEKQTRAAETLLARLAENGAYAILLSRDGRFESVDPSAHLWRVRVEAADYESRRLAWLAALSDSVSDLDEDRLADLFPFSAMRIQQTASLTHARAAIRDPFDPRPTMEDVLGAGRDLTTPNLRRFALAIDPKYQWDDLVLPEDRVRQLRSVVSRVRYRSVVHREWGFGRKLSRAKGLSVLFTGPTGCGKTMAAEVLANELSLRFFQIDLSTVMSKYIGDTERHLSIIFEEAEVSLCLLFIDECDALLGKRTEVKDAHDRYANIEVNYLLQRIEQYQGLCVLATNFQKNLDEAFLRRLHHVVEFPFPDEKARERIWRQHFPEEAPRAPDLDFKFLASQFKIAGGHIRNVVVEAAFLAAQESGSDGRISMAHIIEAVKHEHQKQGKLVMKTDLGPYSRAS
jgi:SpoVK/Ycf46/Vps4 family AAA+-type ATPase